MLTSHRAAIDSLASSGVETAQMLIRSVDAADLGGSKHVAATPSPGGGWSEHGDGATPPASSGRHASCSATRLDRSPLLQSPQYSPDSRSPSSSQSPSPARPRSPTNGLFVPARGRLHSPGCGARSPPSPLSLLEQDGAGCASGDRSPSHTCSPSSTCSPTRVDSQQLGASMGAGTVMGVENWVANLPHPTADRRAAASKPVAE
jgi:hypothetical protein